MSDLFDISVSALQAFQTALSVTENNIANINTPGYAVEAVNLTSVAPQSEAGAGVGQGVNVASITRSVNQIADNQLNSSTSTLGQLNSLQTYTSQVDNIIGATGGGLTTALQSYYSAWSTVANDPTSTSSRQALIGQAQSVAASFQSTNSQLQTLNTGINTGITSDVASINTLSTSIASLNTQISTATAEGAGQAPNELLDQRDEAVTSLSKLVGVTTSTGTNGAINVFVGNGQPLVLQGTATALTTVQNQYNSTQLEISTAADGNNSFSAQITSGDLGGLLAARTQVVDPALNQVGQIAVALSTTANLQQKSGMDLTGQLGANMFTVGAPVVAASTENTGAATAAVSVTGTLAGIGALTSNDYVVTNTGTAAAPTYSLTNAATGSAVTSTGTGLAGSPLTADGLSIVMTGTSNPGDKFLIQPTAAAASGFTAAITNSSQIAAAGAVQTSAATGNTGTGTISSTTVLDPTTNPALLITPATITFTSPTAYTVTTTGGVPPVATGTLTAAGTIAANGWQVQISGTPAATDTFTVQSNAGATGDNRNALASAAQQTQKVLTGGTVSINGATSALVTTIGSQASQTNSAQTAQAAVNTQALASVQSVSGVNLDEEAANLLQWQQAYQASAQALSIGNSLFTTLLNAINGT